jgi:hypothetical protein
MGLLESFESLYFSVRSLDKPNLCSIKLVGVMCFIYIVSIFMLSFVCICVNYGIDVVIRDIVHKSR